MHNTCGTIPIPTQGLFYLHFNFPHHQQILLGVFLPFYGCCPLLLCCRLKSGTSTFYGIHGREKKLSISPWAISGIASMNGVPMVLEFLSCWTTMKPWFSTMCPTSLQFRFSLATQPETVSGTIIIYWLLFGLNTLL